MTYNKDVINLFINQYINNTDLKTISNNLNISVQTLKRWIIILLFSEKCLKFLKNVFL